ncbi:MAG TPA: hypothetical protein VH934_01445 [Xanthobacteraceae bacterium]|jgi:hypothetical protein
MTIDPFLWLTPVLLLAILGLMGFVGCQLFLVDNDPKPAASPKTAAPLQVSGAAFVGAATACSVARLRVTGANFPNGAQVQWSGAALPTQFVSATQLDASVTLSDTALTAADIVVVGPSGEKSPLFHFTFTVAPGAVRVALAQEAGQPSGPNIGPVTTVKDFDFGTGQWAWLRDTTDVFSLHFSSPGTTRTFAFRNGATGILESMTVRNFAGSANTMTVSDEVGQTASVNLPALVQPIQVLTLTTGWRRCSNSITVRLQTPSADAGIIEITYRLPA